ncbi:MAG TPA: hypothetical protein VH721_09120 [Gaiellaceae bacterium]|jgi:hypothetical protein
MSEQPGPEGTGQQGAWAKPVDALTAAAAPEGAPNLVEGKRLVGPIQGFGKMWQKTYKVRLSGVDTTPEAVVAAWREGFPSFWPKGNDFYTPLTGLDPGEVALIKLAGPGGVKLKTGVMVLYSDDVSFTLMTPEGHMFAGWITFSAHDEDGVTAAQTQVLMRAQDPLGELGLAFGGHGKENRFWEQTLANLAASLGCEDADVTTSVVCVDRKRQWSRATNVRHSVAIRSTLHMMKPGK